MKFRLSLARRPALSVTLHSSIASGRGVIVPAGEIEENPGCVFLCRATTSADKTRLLKIGARVEKADLEEPRSWDRDDCVTRPSSPPPLFSSAGAAGIFKVARGLMRPSGALMRNRNISFPEREFESDFSKIRLRVLLSIYSARPRNKHSEPFHSRTI